MTYRIISVAGGGGEGCSRHSDPVVGSVVDRIESLEPGLAEDEVQSRPTVITIVKDN